MKCTCTGHNLPVGFMLAIGLMFKCLVHVNQLCRATATENCSVYVGNVHNDATVEVGL